MPRLILSVCGGFTLLLLGAYLVFSARQHGYAQASAAALAGDVSHPDTVVLTGAAKRIGIGLQLLRDGRTQHVFISGVGEAYSKTKLPHTEGLAPELIDCCIALGYSAQNTAGNGKESAAWLKQRGAQSVFLVTSDFHMPRAIVELRRYAPDIRITPITVARQRRPIQQMREFLKYGASVLRRRLTGPGD